MKVLKKKIFPVTSLAIDWVLTEENQVGDFWEIKGIVLVKDPRRKPAKDISIKFFLDGKEYESAEKTDNDGRAVKTFSGLSSGSHSFEVLIVGTAVRKVCSKGFKGQSKSPAKLLWKQSGKSGNYVIFFQVLTADNKPAKNAVIKILDKTIEESFSKNLDPTDSNGTVSMKVDFSEGEKRRDIIAMVIGSEIREKIHLFN